MEETMFSKTIVIKMMISRSSMKHLLVAVEVRLIHTWQISVTEEKNCTSGSLGY